MKSLNQYIQEKLIINKDYHDGKMYHPESFDELRKIIEDRYDKLGPGTKQDPIDFNDIDVSNIRSFCDNKYNSNVKGIFEYMRFKYIDISDWDVSNIESMRHMFYHCEKLESAGDISKWDVSNVENMMNMFSSCDNFNQDISSWDVSNVTNMRFMFLNCTSFNQDLSKWNVSNARYHEFAFYNCLIKEEYKPKFK